jgi:hypothetical protein
MRTLVGAAEPDEPARSYSASTMSSSGVSVTWTSGSVAVPGCQGWTFGSNVIVSVPSRETAT